MSQDSFTEVTTQSWGSRLGGSIKGIGIGVILVLISVPLMFWNEGRAVNRYKTLKEGGGAVISVPVDRIDAGNEGSLIHITGTADTQDVLHDADFDVSITALRLRRKVEMYQWKESSKSETTKKLGGGTETRTTYTYDKVWSADLLNSGSFKKPEGHSNPGSMPVRTLEKTAGTVNLGAFALSKGQVESIHSFRQLDISPPSSVLEKFGGDAKTYGDGVYIGTNPGAPTVGDVRIRFEVVEPTQVSIVAQQAGDSLRPYTASTGGSIFLLEEGNHGAESMFKAAETSNAILTWVLRFVGLLLMMIGFTAIVRPLSVFADVVPFIGTLVGAGTGCVAFALTLALGLTVIAIAWIFYRPMIGVPLLVIAIASVVGLFLKGKKKKIEPPPIPV